MLSFLKTVTLISSLICLTSSFAPSAFAGKFDLSKIKQLQGGYEIPFERAGGARQLTGSAILPASPHGIIVMMQNAASVKDKKGERFVFSPEKKGVQKRNRSLREAWMKAGWLSISITQGTLSKEDVQGALKRRRGQRGKAYDEMLSTFAVVLDVLNLFNLRKSKPADEIIDQTYLVAQPQARSLAEVVFKKPGRAKGMIWLMANSQQAWTKKSPSASFRVLNALGSGKSLPQKVLTWLKPN